MSIVSGLAAANGASALLSASGNNSTDAARRAKSQQPGPEPAAIRADETLTRIVERVDRVPTQPDANRTQSFQPELAPGNGKYSRFVDAVQALRLDKADAAELTPGRVAELKAAAAEVFNLRSDIPKEESPAEAFQEQRAREIEQEARLRADRERAALRAANLELPEQADPSVAATPVTQEVLTDTPEAERPPVPEPVIAQPTPAPSTPAEVPTPKVAEAAPAGVEDSAAPIAPAPGVAQPEQAPRAPV